MHISSINGSISNNQIRNRQTNFKGDLRFFNAIALKNTGNVKLPKVSLKAEYISAIESAIPRFINPRLTPEIQEEFRKENDLYSTMITMATGDKYIVPAEMDDVLKAKDKVIGTFNNHDFI